MARAPYVADSPARDPIEAAAQVSTIRFVLARQNVHEWYLTVLLDSKGVFYGGVLEGGRRCGIGGR